MSARPPPRPPPPPAVPAGAAGAPAGTQVPAGPEAPGRPDRAGWPQAPAEAARPPAAGLHFVATPIGAARDITLRALDVLAGAELLAAEDTRRLRQLLTIHAIPLAGRTILPYHDRNGEAMRPRLLAALAAGRSVAYVSDAGTPLVADPGFRLARAAIEAGVAVHAVPGPSAVLAALTVAGLPTDRFLFAGFPPPQPRARQEFLAGLADVQATLVLLESPRRVRETLGDLCEILGEGRAAALCRELTKLHEEVLRGTLGELALRLGGADPRGEIVLVIDRPRPQAGPPRDGQTEEAMQSMLEEALADRPLRQAVDAVAAALGLPRRRVYQAALALRGRR